MLAVPVERAPEPLSEIDLWANAEGPQPLDRGRAHHDVVAGMLDEFDRRRDARYLLDQFGEAQHRVNLGRASDIERGPDRAVDIGHQYFDTADEVVDVAVGAA